MPRYFFHIIDGQDYQDRTGVDLADLAAVRSTALNTCLEFMTDHADRFWDGEGWTLHVTDDQGERVLGLSFSALRQDRSS